ncbi:Dynamin-related protein 4C [Castilleja foliolosa]|uniref:Dynamin-related protein 4C n=1 Tax=Castilleja foliolosa TaxID=1961234 RepID=A0ABD3D1X6_9LAMI
MSLVKISKQEENQPSLVVHHAPIVSSYNDRIRPLLDTIDRLRHLKIMQEGIQLPTIVVVGDQSSGKSSVLESLAGISLPRGQGICTRVPLIMRLQNHPNPIPDLSLEYNNKTVPTDEENIADAISLATEEIAGKQKGISNIPLTLVVKKNGVPDLTMVDLPGITRVPVHGQPEDIYEQISKIINEFITPEESIILNVLSASVDFSTCESIRMSQRVDKTGQRTLAVVTKADKSPEGLLEKVTADDVSIGLGYVCVRNRIGDESYEEARAEEAKLFENNPLLSKISKSIVGIPVLAERLVKIQAAIIVKCLPDIVRKINEKLSVSVEELNKMPKHLNSVAEAMTMFMHIIDYAKESLRKILLQGEFDEYPDDKEMHGTTRLAEMLNKYSEELHPNKSTVNDSDVKKGFLVDEIKVLEESKSIGLPNFMPKSAFLTLLHRKVHSISDKPVDFVEKIWSYVIDICVVEAFG